MLERVQPDVVWHPTGFLTGTRDYEGAEGVRQWMEDLGEIASRDVAVLTFPSEYQLLDDGRVLVLGSGRLEREVSPVVQGLGWIWELRAAKVTRMTNYLSHAQAREDAGLEDEAGRTEETPET